MAHSRKLDGTLLYKNCNILSAFFVYLFVQLFPVFMWCVCVLNYALYVINFHCRIADTCVFSACVSV